MQIGVRDLRNRTAQVIDAAKAGEDALHVDEARTNRSSLVARRVASPPAQPRVIAIAIGPFPTWIGLAALLVAVVIGVTVVVPQLAT